MARGIGGIIAALGAFGGGYLKGKQDREEADAREEERRWRREDRSRQEAARTAAADTLGRVGTGVIKPEDAAGVLSPEQQEMMRQDIETFGPDAGKSIIDSAARDAATPAARAAAAGIKPATYTREQATGDYVRRMYGIEPDKAAQTEASQLQMESARSDANWRKRTGETIDVFNRGLLGQDGKPRQATLQESYALAEQLAGINVAHGKGHVYDLAEVKTKAAQAQKEGYVDALRWAHAGNRDEAIRSFNRFGDIKLADIALKPTTMSVGGIQVPTYAISGTTADGKVFNIPSAYGAMVQGMTFEQAAKAEEVGAKKTSAAADIARVGIAGKAEERAATKDARDQAKADAVAKGLADYADAEVKGDAKAMSAARRAILANGGKLERPEQGKADFTPNPVGMGGTVKQIGADNSVVVTPVSPDGKAGAPIRVGPAGAAPPGIANDPRAAAIRDNPKLTTEQKRAKLMELGYR